MSYTALHGALHAHLHTFATSQDPLLEVAWPQRKYRPNAGGTYLRPHVLLSTPRAAGCGEAAADYVRGIYQVDIMTPSGSDWGPGEAIVDALREHFSRGLKLMGDGAEVTVESVARGPELENGKRCKIPVNMTFYAYMTPA